MVAPTTPRPLQSLVETPLVQFFVICTLIMKPAHTPDELLKAMEQHHELYIANLRLLHDLTLKHNSPSAFPRNSGIERSRSHNSPPSTPPRGAGFSHDSLSWYTFGSSRCWRQTNEWHTSRPYHSPTDLAFNDRVSRASSMADNESDYSLSHHSLCTTKPIEQESFTDQELIKYLDSIDDTQWARDTNLQDHWRNGYITTPEEFLEPWDERDDGAYRNATYEVYEICGSGEHKCFPLAKHKENGDGSQEILTVESVWNTLKEVNKNGEAVGRIT